MIFLDFVVKMFWIVDNIILLGNLWLFDFDFRINIFLILINRLLIVFDFNNFICYNLSV